MGIIESLETAPGTHPSRASSITRVQCDRCEKKFRADSRVDGVWKFHGEDVGATDCTGGEAEELCQQCVDEVFDD